MNIKKKIGIISLVVAMCCACSACANLNISTNGDDHAVKAAEFYELGDYSGAIKEAEIAIEKGVVTERVDLVYKIIGASYDSLDDSEKAIAAYEKALEINENNYQVWTNLGVTYRSIGDFDKALECYNKALEIEPEYAEVHSSLGSLYTLQGDAKKAIEYFEKAVELDPTLATCYGNMALALAMEGRFEEAEAALKQAKVLGYQNYEVIQERITALESE